MATYSDSLRSRTDAELVSLLLDRPDLALPAPGSLLSLAARATNRSSLERALASLDAFTLQVLETIVALSPQPDAAAESAADIATFRMDASGIKSAITGSKVAPIRAALQCLRDLALIWPSDDDATWQPAPGLTDLLGPYPAGLAPTGADAAQGDDEDAVAIAPAAGLADLKRLASAPPGAQQLLDALLWGPPVGRAPSSPSGVSTTDWLVAHHFLTRSETAHVFLPRDVALALRKGRAFASSAHQPPIPDAAELSTERIDAQAISAVENSVYLVTELINQWIAQPPAVLRTGGLGVRDLRRLATYLDVDETTAAFTVELAASAGLILDDAELTPQLTPTSPAHEWLTQDLATKWALLAQGWLQSNRTPWLVGSRDARGALHPALGPELTRPWVARLRNSVLSVLADNAGKALTAEQVLEVLTWRTPRSVPPANAIVELLAEAQRLGVVGSGALSTPGDALLGEDDVATGLAQVLPQPVDEILLQGDLTGIVPGRPTAALAQLIDAAAVIESRGGALTVRFTDRSITAALDAGYEGERLLTQLQTFSRTGVPQPLEYLVQDATRRHGRLRIGSASSYVRVEDPAVLTGLVEDPTLRRLGLRALAPTVLVAQVPGPELLTALRDHGLAPVAEGTDGTLVDLEARPTAAPAHRPGVMRPAPVLVETAKGRMSRITGLVERLRDTEALATEMGIGTQQTATTADGAAPKPGAGPDSGTSDPADALTRLREAIDSRTEVWLEVIDAYGEPERRRVRPLRLESGRLRALDLTREAELTVAVHRIARVATTEPS